MTIEQQSIRTLRRLETGLAYFSLGGLLIYVPAETYVSWPNLQHTGYIVDFIAFILLAVGGAHSLRMRPLPGIGPLCAAWGYSVCNAWRAYFGRVDSRVRGLNVYTDLNKSPLVENAVGVAMIIAFAGLFLCLFLAFQYATQAERMKKGDAA